MAEINYSTEEQIEALKSMAKTEENEIKQLKNTTMQKILSGELSKGDIEKKDAVLDQIRAKFTKVLEIKRQISVLQQQCTSNKANDRDEEER